jgi:hypothetical protein
MKNLLAALALISTAYVTSAQAGDVGVSISIGQPGFYGQIDIGGYGPPQVLYRQPVLVERRNWYPAPVYVRAPPYQYGNWRRYCGLYNACARPVYFVRDDWYQNVYAPRYRQEHGRGHGYGHGHGYGQPYVYERYGDDHRDDRSYDRRDYDRYDRNYDHRDDDRGRPH